MSSSVKYSETHQNFSNSVRRVPEGDAAPVRNNSPGSIYSPGLHALNTSIGTMYSVHCTGVANPGVRCRWWWWYAWAGTRGVTLRVVIRMADTRRGVDEGIGTCMVGKQGSRGETGREIQGSRG